MKIKPIIFNSEMVRALLGGRKTQTRRVCRISEDATHIRARVGAEAPANSFVSYWVGPDGEELGGTIIHCPYGQPGDLLWVREGISGRQYAADFKPVQHDGGEQCAWLLFKRDYADAIYMPRWASRLTLEITDVRVQRVQEISEGGAKAEGIEPYQMRAGVQGWRRYCQLDGDATFIPFTAHPRVSFMSLWDSINAKRGFGWDANPWVWAITFKVHRCNVDDFARELGLGSNR